MFIDWLKSFRRSNRPSRRRICRHLSSPVALEPRTLLSAVPVGLEFRVNTTTTGDQIGNTIAIDSNGNFVIVWESQSQDGDGLGIFAQKFNGSGLPIGAEFQVNSFTTNNQSEPAVAMNSQGDFVVTWASNTQDGSSRGIFAQRFNTSGIPQGTEFRANSYTTGQQRQPAVAIDADGDFVITWRSDFQDGDSSGIYAQRFNAQGISQGSEILVNTITTGTQNNPAVALDSIGNFVITWYSHGGAGIDLGVSSQRFDFLGNKIGGEFAVSDFHSPTTNYYAEPAIALDSDGDFVIAWSVPVNLDSNSWRVMARKFQASGTPVGAEFEVSSFATVGQWQVSLAVEPEGGFLVSWASHAQDGSGWGVYAQRFSPHGFRLGSELHVNTHTTGDQSSPVIAMNADGEIVISWSSDGQDGNGYGIYAQRYELIDTGEENRVNTFTTSHQSQASVAVDASGDYVVVWLSTNQEGVFANIYGQRFNTAGIPQGTEFRVNSSTTNLKTFPKIAVDGDGGFVVTWSSWEAGSNSWDILARSFGADGIAQGIEYQVNTVSSKSQSSPQVAMNDDGDFIITWTSYHEGSYEGVYAQRYNAAGIPQGSEFQVNTHTSDPQFLSSVAVDAEGNFVITWQSEEQDGSGYGIYAQRYNAGGVPQGMEFRVNSFTTGHQESPLIGMDSEGDFIIAWEGQNQVGYGSDILAQRFNSQGTPQGVEFRVNTYTSLDQKRPSIAMDSDGDFVVTWESEGQDGSDYGVHGQRYNANGSPIGTEFRVNTYTTDAQSDASISMDANGDFVVVWQSIGQDGSGSGIYNRQYHAINPPPGPNTAPTLNNAGNPTLDPLIQNQSLASNNGTLVADIIARMGPSGGITDADLDPLGIAINGVSNTYGSWQFTVNGGTNWTPITVTGNTNALLLAADGNTRVRFLPNANYIGSSLFSFVAWDRSSGANGGTANVASRGGMTPFSLAYETASISVNNTAPVLNAAGSPTLNTIPMNVYGADNTGTLVSDIIARMAPAGGITDANPGALQGIAINGLGNTATGDWQFSTNGGTTWSLIGTTGNSNARLLAADANTRIRYVPQVGYIGSASLSFVAWDRTSGANGGSANVGTRGGSTPYSTAYEYASIAVVNAAPVLNDSGNPLLDGILPNVPDASNAGTLVSTLISRMAPAGGITDANNNSPRGIAVIGKNGSGTWEFSTNNGTSWSALGSTSAANATLLASDANTRIRYRPTAGFTGTAAIAFVAWDQSTGTNGTVVNASTRGGTTAFSTAYEYASIYVNTAPTLNNAGTPTLDSISNTLPVGTNTGILVTTLLSRMAPLGGITDPDPAALKGLAIIGQNGTLTGSWQYSTNNGTSWTNVTTTGSANALLLASDANTRIRYVPNAGFTGTVVIAFAAWDRSQGLNGSTVNAGARGGSTPFSLDYDTALITITA